MSLELAKVFVNKTYNRRYCSAYTVLMEDGSHSGMHSTACYGGLTYGKAAENNPVAVVNQLQTDYRRCYESLPKGTGKAYLNWLVNDSVFSDTFLERDVDKILEEGIWVTRCDIPGNVMVAAMICVRALTENDRSCRSGEVFMPLVGAGCTPEFAFILGHFMSESQLKTQDYDSHHCVFSWGDLTIPTVVNFCNKKFINQRKENWCQDKIYSGVHNLFKQEGKSFVNWLVQTYKAIDSGAEDFKQTGTNPFASSSKPKADGVVMGENKFEVMAKVCDLFYKEFVK